MDDVWSWQFKYLSQCKNITENVRENVKEYREVMSKQTQIQLRENIF